MNTSAELRFDLKKSIIFFSTSLFIQFFIGSSIWTLCNSVEQNKPEKKLNITFETTLDSEVIQEQPQKILDIPEIENFEPQKIEMTIDDITPVDPFEKPRLIEKPIVPKIEKKVEKKKVKEIRKDAPKIIKPEIEEVPVTIINTPEKTVENSKPINIPANIEVKEKNNIPTASPKIVLTKSQLDENSKYLVKIMKIFERNKVYPNNARFSRIEGKIIVSFKVDKNGRTNTVLAKTKEPKILATAAEELVRKAKLPTPPSHWNLNDKIDLPIVYKLK